MTDREVDGDDEVVEDPPTMHADASSAVPAKREFRIDRKLLRLIRYPVPGTAFLV